MNVRNGVYLLPIAVSFMVFGCTPSDQDTEQPPSESPIPPTLPSPTITPVPPPPEINRGNLDQLAAIAAIWPDDQILELSPNPHKNTLAAAGGQGIWLLNLDTLDRICLLSGHSSSVSTIEWSPEGTHLASGNELGEIRLGEACGAEETEVLKGHIGTVRDVAWSPDASQLASSGDDATIRLWDPGSHEQVLILRGHEAPVYSLAWSTDGTTIASASLDGTVRLWDATDGTQVHLLGPFDAYFATLDWSPNDTLLAAAGLIQDGGAIWVWEVDAWAEPMVLEGHSGIVWRVAWSDDGSRLASAGEDETVRIWSFPGGVLLQTLEGHGGEVWSVAWLDDGDRILSGGNDRLVRIWDALEGTQLQIQRSQGHYSSVGSWWDIAWSPDGTKLASGGLENTVRIWAADTREQLNVLEGHTDWITDIDWSPDASMLVTSSQDGTLRIWDPLDGTELMQLEGHTDSIHAVDWSPDGKYIASGSDDDTVRIWQATTGELIHLLFGHTNDVTAVEFSPNNELLASSAVFDQIVIVWDVEDGKAVAHLVAGESGQNTLAWSNSGMQLASAGRDYTIRIWDTSTWTRAQSIEGSWSTFTRLTWTINDDLIALGGKHDVLQFFDISNGVPLRAVPTLAGLPGSEMPGLDLSPDGRQLASISEYGAINIWGLQQAVETEMVSEEPKYDSSSFLQIARLGVEPRIDQLAISPDGEIIAAIGGTDAIRLYDAETLEPIGALAGFEGEPVSVMWSPDGSEIASGHWNGHIYLWSPDGQKASHWINGYAPVWSLTWSADGTKLAAGGRKVRIWDMASKTLILELEKSGKMVIWSPDGSLLASVSSRIAADVITVWDVSTGDVYRRIGGGGYPVTWSPDSTLIASSGGRDDSTVTLWDASTSEKRHVLEGHLAYVTTLAWSPTGSMMATGDYAGFIKLWDAVTLEEITTIHAHPLSRVTSLVWSPDGKTLISGGYEGTLATWSIPQGAPQIIRESQGHLSEDLSGVSWSMTERRLATAGDYTARIWDATTGDQLKVFRGMPYFALDVSWSPDGTKVIALYADSSIWLWEAATGELIGAFGPYDQVFPSYRFNRAEWSPDGGKIALALEHRDRDYRSIDGGAIWIWDVASGEGIRLLEGHVGNVLDLAWSPDGQRLASGGSDETIRIWDISSASEVFNLADHSSAVNGIAWSPDGSFLASASSDGSVRVWDMEDGEQEFILEGHLGAVTAVDWSPDGNRIVSVDWDGSLRIWDRESQDQLNLMGCPMDCQLIEVSWLQDGIQAISIDQDENILLWKVREE